MSSKLNSATFAVIAIYAGNAHAEEVNIASAKDAGASQAMPVSPAKDASQTMIKFSGFGTLGITHSSERRGDYVPDGGFPHGAGISSDWNTSNTSLFGVQVAGAFTPQLKGVLQVVSEYDADNTYRPVVEWANVKYSFTPNMFVRIGRIALPTFIYSDSRDVGYSYPWIHPPVDVYRQLAITHNDGIDGSYRSYVGEASNTVKIVLSGRAKQDRPSGSSTSTGIWGVFDTFEYGATSYRLGYQARNVSSQYSSGVTTTSVRNTDLSAGVVYDPGKWFVMSEWIQRKSTTKKHAAYISAGYRIDHVTPYLTFSKDSPASFESDNPVPTASAIQRARNAQSTAAFGTRWDFMKNADLKFQYDRIRLSADSNGNLANVPAGTILYGSTFHVISMTLDFIF